LYQKKAMVDTVDQLADKAKNSELHPSESCIRHCLKLTIKWVCRKVSYKYSHSFLLALNGRSVSDKSLAKYDREANERLAANSRPSQVEKP
jgi:hypothetical protein